MVTLAVMTLGGKKRRCDARCYSAKRDKCRCICGGTHHGMGLDKAIEFDRAIDKIVEEALA